MRAAVFFSMFFFLAQVAKAQDKPLKTKEHVFIWGKLFKVTDTYIIVTPPRGVNDMKPRFMPARAGLIKLKANNPAKYQAWLDELKKVKEEGGYKIPSTPLALTKTGIALKDLKPGKWVLVFLDITRASPAPVDHLYVFKSLYEMFESKQGIKYHLRDLYKKNIYLVYHRLEIRLPEKEEGKAPSVPPVGIGVPKGKKDKGEENP